MVKVKRNDTDIENIYSYFEFVGFDNWDQCDEILSILTNQMSCEIITTLEGVYSRHFVLNYQGLVFKLLHHEDFGNCLCNQKEMSTDYYKELGDIATIVASFLNKVLKR